ncbi:hypothetical protein PQX77_011998, partial [Marasmius sp. AFHP31]
SCAHGLPRNRPSALSIRPTKPIFGHCCGLYEGEIFERFLVATERGQIERTPDDPEGAVKVLVYSLEANRNAQNTPFRQADTMLVFELP